jgi:hypothetical protein
MDFWEIGCENMDFIHLVQGSIHWWVFVNVVMNLWLSQKEEITWAAEQQFFQERLRTLKLSA